MPSSCTLTTLFVFKPSKMHIATMSEHLIVKALSITSKRFSLLGGEVNVVPVVATIISPAPALVYADCRADVATVTVAAETMCERYSS